MWDPVTLLETIGADADLMSGDVAELRESLEGVGLAPALRSALLEGNAKTLRELLRAPDIVCCLIDPSEEEDDEEEEEEEEEDDEEETAPGQKPKPRDSSP
ncbi:MAG: hypothetical protein KGJ72_08375 [Gammaproteobacteria bacterium]|nr:hypothetical protein [Gammaproteobacteria bacterium]